MGLKECPFCGNKTIRILSDWEIEGIPADEGAGVYTAICCMGAYGDRGCGASSGYRETAAEAANAWNRRTKDGNTAVEDQAQYWLIYKDYKGGRVKPFANLEALHEWVNKWNLPFNQKKGGRW